MTRFQQLMSVAEFSKAINDGLKIHISENKIYAMIREPGFPSIKIGGRFYVLADKVDEWLNSKAYLEKNKDR